MAFMYCSPSVAEPDEGIGVQAMPVYAMYCSVWFTALHMDSVSFHWHKSLVKLLQMCCTLISLHDIAVWAVYVGNDTSGLGVARPLHERLNISFSVWTMKCVLGLHRGEHSCVSGLYPWFSSQMVTLFMMNGVVVNGVDVPVLLRGLHLWLMQYEGHAGESGPSHDFALELPDTTYFLVSSVYQWHPASVQLCSKR